jgi:hypothetical protein
LGTIMEHAIVDAEDVAAWLRLPVPLVHALAGDASGSARVNWRSQT